MIHELKCWPEHFQAVITPSRNKRKMVEIRIEDDRKFDVDDELLLCEYFPNEKRFSGNKASVYVSHCLRGLPFVPEGYVAMSIHLQDFEVYE